MNVHKNAKLTPKGREDLVERVLVEKQSVREVSCAMGVSRRTIYKWVKRYEAEGAKGLEDRSSRPHRSPREFQLKLVKRIERLRRRRYTGLRIAEELGLAVSTVSLWLRRLGLGRLRNIDPKPVVVRYEKRRPGELLHLDTKKLGKIKGIGHRITGNRRGSGHGLGWEFRTTASAHPPPEVFGPCSVSLLRPRSRPHQSTTATSASHSTTDWAFGNTDRRTIPGPRS